MKHANPFRLIIAAFAALALVFAPLAAFATATVSVNVAADQWYDLGAGPAMIQGVNATVFWTVADTQPALSAPVSGTAYLAGVPVNTASHIWARTFPGFSSAVIVTPLTAGGSGGGGGGAVTAADGALATIGALADGACGTDNGSCTVEAVLKRIAQRLTSLIAATLAVTDSTTETNTGSTATNTGATNTNLGAPGATACSTDTGSCSLNALLQRLAQRLTSLIAATLAVTDSTTETNTGSTATNTGATNTNLGAPGATACSTDTGSCSLNALLQRLAQRLTSLIGSTLSVTDSTTEANTGTTATNTGTAATDLGAPGATACSTDTGSCSANALLQRIAQRLTSLIGSTLATNSFAAAPSPSITRPANTTTYTANTGWNNGTPAYFTFTGACAINGEQVLIPEIDIWSSANPSTKLQGILWLFKAIPGTLVSDDATFNIASADFANLTGGAFNGVPFTLASAQASGAGNSGVSLTASSLGAPLAATCASGATAFYGMVQVVNAYVPASGEVLTVVAHTMAVN